MQTDFDKEMQKLHAGELYDALHPRFLEQLAVTADVCYEFNSLRPSQVQEREAIIRKLLGGTGERFRINAPFRVDYGFNVTIGEDFFSNFGLTILDEEAVTFGNNVFIGPNCSFFTAGHPVNVEQRNAGLEYAKPIHVGDNVWFGGNVTVMPGVTIGSNTIIGGGSVVVKNIPDGVIAVGNPCRVVRHVDAADLPKQ